MPVGVLYSVFFLNLSASFFDVNFDILKFGVCFCVSVGLEKFFKCSLKIEIFQYFTCISRRPQFLTQSQFFIGLLLSFIHTLNIPSRRIFLLLSFRMPLK